MRLPRLILVCLPIFLASGIACSGSGDGDGSGSSEGDGDGDAQPGDGDGSVGDGDGTTGDGDGDDPAGDGDGDGSGGSSSGDGDGDVVVPADCEKLHLCGEDGKQNCCARASIPGGTYPMGIGDDSDACPADTTCGAHEGPEHDVTVNGFFLDVYEVTVGRFRAFVESYDALSFSPGDGAHPLIEGSGYQEEFGADLPANEAELRTLLACDDDASFTEAAGDNEGLPINCVNWVTAFAFCVFDGGRLPTEAEWEFAAAGGDDNRLYPWGGEAPSDSRAVYFPADLAVSGSLADGEGRYGNRDLAGNVWEWNLDWLDTGWYSGGGAECTDCARVSSGTHRAIRGGAYSYQEATLRAATRSGELPSARDSAIGFRCAYD